MNLEIPPDTSLWEAMATVQILQALPGSDFVNVEACKAAPEVADLLTCAGLPIGNGSSDWQRWNYGGAYRCLDTTEEPYCCVLAAVNDLIGLRIPGPQFPHVRTADTGGIVVSPFAPRQELLLPENVWRGIVHYLRGFGEKVFLIGGRGQWQDSCGYTEDEILTERSMENRLSILAGAKLVVGVPNAFTWAATYWQKKMIYFYPASAPVKRWFHWPHPNYGRAVYRADQIQVPVMLYQLRQLIQMI